MVKKQTMPKSLNKTALDCKVITSRTTNNCSPDSREQKFLDRTPPSPRAWFPSWVWQVCLACFDFFSVHYIQKE
jgi:hypothetical protein